MIKLKLWQIDAFASKPFTGNPAAVVLLEEQLPDAILQNIAMENNLSETAFLLKQADGEWLLRWFTPKTEIDLCGHATLSAAHVLMSYIEPDRSDVTFQTKFVGPLPVSKKGDMYTLNFPSRGGETVEIKDIPACVIEGCGNKTPIEARKARDLMLVFENENDVRDAKINMSKLYEYPEFVIMTAPSSNYDFISRFFCAGDGVDEDPVTGSAHCTLAPYWAKRLGKDTLNAYQASERGGEVLCEMKGDRVHMSGKAFTVIEGLFSL